MIVFGEMTQKKYSKILIKYILLIFFMVKNTMAYEEASYQVVQKFENFEIRSYQERYVIQVRYNNCLLYTSPSPRDRSVSRMPSSA